MADQIIFKVHDDLFRLGSIQETKDNMVKIETFTGTTQWLPHTEVFAMNPMTKKESNVFKVHSINKLLEMFGSNEYSKGLQENSITTYKGTINKILRGVKCDSLIELEKIKNLYNETAINKFYKFVESLETPDDKDVDDNNNEKANYVYDVDDEDDNNYIVDNENADEDNDENADEDDDENADEDNMVEKATSKQKYKIKSYKRKISRSQEKQKLSKKRYGLDPNDTKNQLVSKPCGFLYVVQEKRHEDTNIYKIGRTTDLFQRLKGYPEGKLIHAVSVCLDELEDRERMLKRILTKRLEKKKEGYEYFEGDRKVFLEALHLVS